MREDKMKRIGHLGICLCCMLLSSCATVGLGGLASPALTGALTVERPAGDVTITPERCASGDRWNFYGVDLVDASGAGGVRLAIDPIAGPRVRVQLPGDEGRSTIVLDEAHCSTYRADVHHNGWTVNDFRSVDGRLELDCASNKGEHVQGVLTFRQCH
jgi:hypothetical protein